MYFHFVVADGTNNVELRQELAAAQAQVAELSSTIAQLPASRFKRLQSGVLAVRAMSEVVIAAMLLWIILKGQESDIAVAIAVTVIPPFVITTVRTATSSACATDTGNLVVRFCSIVVLGSIGVVTSAVEAHRNVLVCSCTFVWLALHDEFSLSGVAKWLSQRKIASDNEVFNPHVFTAVFVVGVVAFSGIGGYFCSILKDENLTAQSVVVAICLGLHFIVDVVVVGSLVKHGEATMGKRAQKSTEPSEIVVDSA